MTYSFRVILGPIGWLVALASKDKMRTCPFCAESIKPEARVCRHCGRDLPDAETKESRNAGKESNRSQNAAVIPAIAIAGIVLVVFIVAYSVHKQSDPVRGDTAIHEENVIQYAASAAPSAPAIIAACSKRELQPVPLVG